MMIRRLGAGLLLGTWLAIAPLPGLALPYEVRALPGISPGYSPGDGSVAAFAINNAGQVAGYSATGLGPVHAIVWDNQLAPTDLTPGSPFESMARAINDSGQVGGSAGDSPTVWNGTTATRLDTLGGPRGMVDALNDRGQAVGISDLPGGTSRATLWNGRAATALPLDVAAAINNAGVVVGASELSAVRWENGSTSRLGKLDGDYSGARDINDAGQIAGFATNAAGRNRAVIWNGDTPTPLATPDGNASFAWGINEAGEVAGSVEADPQALTHAVLWRDGTLIDLNQYLSPESVSAGWVLTRALDINDRGEVLAEGRRLDQPFGDSQPFLLSPVPEASSLLMSAAGLGWLGLMGARRRLRHPAAANRATPDKP